MVKKFWTRSREEAIFLKGGSTIHTTQKRSSFADSIAYAFATEPEGPPSGTVNFSLIKDQIVQFELNPQPTYARDVRVYGASHNVLRFSEEKLIFYISTHHNDAHGLQ